MCAPSSHSSQPSGSDAASRPPSRCIRPGHSARAIPDSAPSATSPDARAAATAIPALSSWCAPSSDGAGSATAPAASEKRTPPPPHATSQSRPRSSTGAPTASACPSSAPSASPACAPSTTGVPGFMIPAFSRAISASVSPRKSWWSSEIEVIAHTRGGGITLVASARPPSPTSSTHSSAGTRANSSKLAATSTSNTVIAAPSLTAATASITADSASSLTSSPASRMRSLNCTRCGEV